MTRIAALLAICGQLCCGCITTGDHGVVDTQLVTGGLAGVAATNGAQGNCDPENMASGMDPPPAELHKTTLPTYRIEPPDVLLLEGVRLAPKAPYYIGFRDTLQIVGSGTLPEQPLAAVFEVDSSGQVDLGPGYGVVKIQGLTLDEASDAIARQLRGVLQSPQVSVTLIQPAGQQIVGGEHQVAPDGTINLGIYGSVYVAGMTVDEARCTIEAK
ncbi:MAG TPA: polysaccharide biosynthesis/export family protein, partial [Pirellulaceae bacterium]